MAQCKDTMEVSVFSEDLEFEDVDGAMANMVAEPSNDAEEALGFKCDEVTSIPENDVAAEEPHAEDFVSVSSDAEEDEEVIDKVAKDLDDIIASETTEETLPGDVPVDTDATNSDSDIVVASEEGEGDIVEQTEGRILHVHATLPQDLSFVTPPDCAPGQLLTVQGPHGPLLVQAPAGVKARQRCTVRLAPPFQHEVFVPAGAKPGQKVTFFGPNDEQLEAIVPPGVRPGQVFHVSPPAVMVPIPAGSVKGDRLAFTTPDGKARIAAIPEDLGPGQYFAVQY